MTKEECRKLVIDIISDIAPDEDLSNVKPDVRLRDQMQLDSMDFLDIVMELRKRHRIQIPEDDYVNLASMNSTVTYLEPLMKDIEREAGFQERDWNRIKEGIDRTQKTLEPGSDRAGLRYFLKEAAKLPANQRITFIDSALKATGAATSDEQK